MEHILRITKRKRNLQRLSVLWIALVMIELLCPVLSDEHHSAAAAELTRSDAAVSVSAVTGSEISNEVNSVSADNQIKNYHSSTVCNDECLCHATAIPNLIIPTVKQPRCYSERMGFLFVNPVYSSLPPPFHPPKLS